MGNICFVMSLSGFAVLLIYIAAYPFIKNIFKAKWKYNILRFSVTCFLVPIPYFKLIIRGVCNRFLIFAKPFPSVQETISLSKAFYVLVNDYEIRYSNPQLLLTSFYIICAIVASVVLLLEIFKFIKLKNLIAQCSCETTEAERQLLLSEKAEIKLKRDVTLLKSKFVSLPSATGIFRPVILLPYDYPVTDKNLREILRHEMAHIKHSDTLWYFLVILTVAVHWFNPCTYILLYCMKEVREQYCDEVAVDGLNQADRLEYCSSIINASKRNCNGNPYSVAMGYVGNTKANTKKQIKRRISMIMNEARKNKTVFSVIAFLLFMSVGFITNLYTPTMVVYASERFSMDGDEFVDGGEINIETLYSPDYFVDMHGDSYRIPDDELRIPCFHNYVEGYRKMHNKKSDGGCTLKYYDAKRCTICNRIVVGELVKTETYETCPH